LKKLPLNQLGHTRWNKEKRGDFSRFVQVPSESQSREKPHKWERTALYNRDVQRMKKVRKKKPKEKTHHQSRKKK